MDTKIWNDSNMKAVQILLCIYNLHTIQLQEFPTGSSLLCPGYYVRVNRKIYLAMENRSGRIFLIASTIIGVMIVSTTRTGT